MDEILEELGLTYEELNDVERTTYQKWYDDLSTKEITVADIREYIKSLRLAVDQELSEYNNSKDKDIHLKARLQCYIALELFLSGPEIARERLIAWIKSLKKS